MKTKLLFFFAVALLALQAAAQCTLRKETPGGAQEICGIMPYLEQMKSKDPSLQKRMDAYEEQIQQWIANNPNGRQGNQSSNVVITIPVCVHVVYNTPSQNVSDNQVKSQIQVLNEDFGRTNLDASQTPAAFAGVAANTNIQFCLAQRDPNGNPSTGIERRQTTVASFSQNNAVKFFAQGGLDIWDPTRYMNIWVCYFGGSGLLGYGEFPAPTTTQTFGVVIDYEVFGSNYTSFGTFPLFINYDRGRTTTHEFSHCFNLRHIWGDDGCACTGTDFCADTPNQGCATSGCFTYPHTDACSPANPGIMFMNYMDYSDDGCKNLFTQNQSARMNAVLSTTPYNALATSNGCQPVILVANDAGVFSITKPNGNICGTSFAPIVVLKNWGNNSLTSCVINYKVDNNPVSTFNWTGSLASLQTTNVTLPSVSTTGGAHTFTAYTTLPNSTTDGNPANDQSTSNFTVFAGGAALPFFEGFENATFPPAGWALSNPDNGITWARTTNAAKTGVASAWMNNFIYTCNGCIDVLTTPDLNLTTQVSPQMTFQVAYRMQSDPSLTPNWSDTLEIDITTNCGVTWNQVYKKYSTPLTTITPSWAAVNFVPGPTNWRLETISLSPYATAADAFIRFYHTTDYENNMYIDDININGITGTSNYDPAGNVHLFPNPTSGLLYLDAHFDKADNLKLMIYDVVGREVGGMAANNTMGGQLTLDISDKPDGVYFIKVSTDTQTFTQRVVLNR